MPTISTMEPIEADIVIHQGTTFSIPIQWKYLDKDGNEKPVDLTGAIPGMQIRRRLTSTIAELDLGESGYIFIADAKEGLIQIMIPPEATRALDFSSGVYDIEITFAGGYVTRIMQGTVTLNREVTR